MLFTKPEELFFELVRRLDKPITSLEERQNAGRIFDGLCADLSRDKIDISSPEWEEVFERCRRFIAAHNSFPAAPSERVFENDHSARANHIREIAPAAQRNSSIYRVDPQGGRFRVFGRQKSFLPGTETRVRKKR